MTAPGLREPKKASTREGQSQDQIVDELESAIEAALDDLDRWLTPATD